MTGTFLHRAQVAGLLATLAVVAAACSASTVTGHGSAAPQPTLATTPTDGFPSVTDFPSSGFPTPPLSSLAPPSGSSTPVPGGVEVVDEGGHFRVIMPAEPARTTQPGSFGEYTFNVHICSVTEPYVAIVEGEDISPALTSDSFGEVLNSAIDGFESSSGLTAVSKTDTTFQGHQARKAVFSREGVRYVFLAFVFSGSQIYALFAPEGEKFDALSGSFQATA